MLDTLGLDMMDYDKCWEWYRLRLNKGDVTRFSGVLSALAKKQACVVLKQVRK